MSRKWPSILTLALAASAAAPAFADRPHQIVDNGSVQWPDSASIKVTLDDKAPKVGLAAIRCDYSFSAEGKYGELALPENTRPLANGKLAFWLKGDGSANDLQLVMQTAVWRTESDGRRVPVGVRNVELPRVKLNDANWKEVTLDLTGLVPADGIAWLARARVLGVGPTDKNATQPSRFEGSFEVDDFRLYPASSAPIEAATSANVLGPSVRDFTSDFSVSLDARNFTAKAASMKVRLTMVDRNQNPVTDRDFTLELAANAAKEFKLDLAPENIGLYLPPFRVSGDVISTELPALATRVDLNVVMSNSKILLDNFADVYGRWHTRGYPGFVGRSIGGDPNLWITWMMGEATRAVPLTQTTARISRVEVERPAEGASAPPDRYAMKIDVTGESAVFNGAERYLPGNAFKFGVWVKGDGSNGTLQALFFDYTDLADFYAGGWKRIGTGMRTICKLNFTDWRYIEVPLPGNGIGSNTLRGSTDGLDFPLELSAFVVTPEAAKAPAAGAPAAPAPATSASVLIGPIYAITQQNASGTLAAMIGYDNPDLDYSPKAGATVSLQNAWRVGARKVEASWTLANRDNQPILTGRQEVEVPAGQTRNFRIELAAEAAKIEAQPAPYRLQVVAIDKADASTSVTREVDLARADAVFPLADFETDRGFLPTKGEAILTTLPPGEPAAFTTTDEAHGGKRSLRIAWEKDAAGGEEKPAAHGKSKSKKSASKEKDRPKDAGALQIIAIDPPIPGVSVEMTMWVKGDGSGALFYPVIGGPKGVRHGLATRNWNFFLPRVVNGALQDAVVLDFTDWRQFTFKFAPVPSDFDKPLPVLHYLPTYPQGLHLAVDGRLANGDSGEVYVDDIVVRTHLDAANRLGFSLRRESESNVTSPDAKLVFRASNFDVAGKRAATISGGIYNWRGERVASLDSALELAPGEQKDIVLSQKVPPGAYELRVQMKEGDRVAGAIQQDLLVADLSPMLSADWLQALKDEWKLRVPIKDDFTYLDEDWDWVEYYPGNIQTQTMKNRYSIVKNNGARPWMLLGFSALWSSGSGFEQFKMGAFQRVNRHVGQGVDIFLVPARDIDWENYVMEVFRSVGSSVAGWVLWDNPDGTSSLALTPQRLASFIQIADKWRTAYCPTTPMIIGGMARATAIPYLNELGKNDALARIGGVNIRMDVGRMSPEDSQVLPYARQVREVLARGGEGKQLLLTELDWAVEKSAAGLDVFDQAAYLSRSDFLLSRVGVTPALSIRNGDFERLGTGLAYRMEVQVPPMREQTLTYNLKPAWWAMVRTRQFLSQARAVDQVPVQDVVPDRTQAMLFERQSDGKAVVVAWRNDDAGWITFTQAGLAVESAEDIFGAPATVNQGWYAVGKMPTLFTLKSSASTARDALSRLWVRDGQSPAWSQSVLARWNTESAAVSGYANQGGTPTTFTGRTYLGVSEQVKGLAFAKGGSEALSVDVPAGASVVLRKRYFLDKAGQSATVTVNGKPAGRWNLKRSEAALTEGLREAVFVLDASLLAGQPKAQVVVTYEDAANTIDWTALACQGGDFPLSAIGPVHADQQAGPVRVARNIAGGSLKVDTETFANGIGAFANSLLEYPLNGQFKRFVTKVGVDAATEGKGSVIFEVWADGKKVWSSGVMSGLDRAKNIDLDVTGVDRLRLIVNDGGDGNKFDAGDWCDPVLKR